MGKVVLGKYLAMAFVFTIDMVIIAITPLLLMSYGKLRIVSIGTVISMINAIADSE